MTAPQLHHVLCPDAPPGRRMAYWQWGEAAAAHLVLCVHGLTRHGRDFDGLAADLVAHAQGAGRSLRVVSVDVAGRGASDWLPDASLYQPLTYLADLQALLRQLQAQAPVRTFDWVGTSMGGLIGMLAAVQPQAWPAPIRRLVLNDVGPVLAWEGLERIRGYVGDVGPYASVAEGVARLRQRLAGFGPHTDVQWHALNAPMFKPVAGASLESGPVVLNYDPAIARPFATLTREANAQSAEFMRGVYAQIASPTLLLRGAQSELLTREAALEMTRTGPRSRLVEFAGVGHAPTLVADEQLQVVRAFLLGA